MSSNLLQGAESSEQKKHLETHPGEVFQDASKNETKWNGLTLLEEPITLVA